MDNMEKNYLKYTCIWALIILAGLLLMYFLPAFTVGEHVMRRVDLLGDVRTQKDIAEEPDSLLPPPPKVKPAFVDTKDTVVKGTFIEVLLPFASRLTSGAKVDNVRQQINNMLMRQGRGGK